MPGTKKILKRAPSGNLKTWATGFTTVLGLVFDERDRMYVLESMTAPGFQALASSAPERSSGLIRMEHKLKSQVG